MVRCQHGATVVAVKKARIDTVLAERGLFASRSAAAGAVRAGEVRVGVDGPLALRPSQLVEPEVALFVDSGPRYVSRGGVKLANALGSLRVAVAGRDCLDVGASTGGFVDCLLQSGAKRVVALDVAFGQLAAKLRADPRVTVIERSNARDLSPSDLPFAPDLATVDVSFISLAQGATGAGALPCSGREDLGNGQAAVRAGSRAGRQGRRQRPRRSPRGGSRRGACRPRPRPCRQGVCLSRACGSRREIARPSSGVAMAVGKSTIWKPRSRRSNRDHEDRRADHPFAPAGGKRGR